MPEENMTGLHSTPGACSSASVRVWQPLDQADVPYAGLAKQLGPHQLHYHDIPRAFCAGYPYCLSYHNHYCLDRTH